MAGDTGSGLVVDTVKAFRRLMFGTGVVFAAPGVAVLAFFLMPGIDPVTAVVLVLTSAMLVGSGGWLIHQYLTSRRSSVGFVFDDTGFTIRRPAAAAMGSLYHFRFLPRGEEFAAAHPQLEDLREDTAYRWNLGPYRRSANRVVDAVNRFQPRLAPEIRTQSWSESH